MHQIGHTLVDLLNLFRNFWGNIWGISLSVYMYTICKNIWKSCYSIHRVNLYFWSIHPSIFPSIHPSGICLQSIYLAYAFHLSIHHTIYMLWSQIVEEVRKSLNCGILISNLRLWGKFERALSAERRIKDSGENSWYRVYTPVVHSTRLDPHISTHPFTRDIFRVRLLSDRSIIIYYTI